jgi:hypothetical protein
VEPPDVADIPPDPATALPPPDPCIEAPASFWWVDAASFEVHAHAASAATGNTESRDTGRAIQGLSVRGRRKPNPQYTLVRYRPARRYIPPFWSVSFQSELPSTIARVWSAML